MVVGCLLSKLKLKLELILSYCAAVTNILFLLAFSRFLVNFDNGLGISLNSFFIVVTVTLGFFELGLSAHVIRELSTAKSKQNLSALLLTSYVYTTLVICLVITACMTSKLLNYPLFGTALLQVFKHQYFELVLFLAVARFMVGFLLNIYSGSLLLIRQSSIKTGANIFGILLLIWPTQYTLEYLAVFLAFLATAVIINQILYYKIALISIKKLWKLFSFKSFIGISLFTSSTTFFAVFEKFIVSNHLDAIDFNIYILVTYLAYSLVQVFYPITNVTYPYMNRKLWPAQTFKLIIICLSLTACIILIFFSYNFYDQFIEYWLSNKEVTNRIVDLGKLSWLVIFSIAFSVLPDSFLLTLRKERYLVLFRLIQILLFPVLMVFYGGEGLQTALHVFLAIGFLYTLLVWLSFFISREP